MLYVKENRIWAIKLFILDCQGAELNLTNILEIDIPNRKLNVRLSDAEIEERLKKVEVPERKLTPLLESYRKKFTGVNCYGEKVKA